MNVHFFQNEFLNCFHPHLFAEKFHTLALEGVPIFGLHNRTAAYRFVTLVDVRQFSVCSINANAMILI